MNKTHTLISFALAMLLCTVVSCGDQGPKYEVGQEITVSGVMKIYDNDGEVYVIVTENKEFYDVHDIKEQYKKDDVPIKAVIKVVAPRCLHGFGPEWSVVEYQ